MNNLSLYQITNNFTAIMEQEEITPELKEILQKELAELLQQKSQNVIGYTRNIELTIEAMKTEEKRISEQRKTLENKLDKFKQYVKDCMEQNGIQKVDTGIGSLTISKNPISVEILNEEEVPKEFKTVILTTKINKIAIKKHFEETGEIPTGTKINTQNTSLRIK